jgi:hypothetical protein
VRFTDEILDSLKELSKVQKTNQKNGLVTGTAIMESIDIGDVEKRIEGVLENYRLNGEMIVTQLRKGEIVDSGTRYFDILGGYVIEFYEYEKTTAVFIRNYLISDGEKKWIAVYIDENPETPWWERDAGLMDG